MRPIATDFDCLSGIILPPIRFESVLAMSGLESSQILSPLRR